MTGEAAPFSLPERMLAERYLRARRRQGGIAAIAIISVVGVALSVFALVTTMSIMNGFREELLANILGVRGHVFVDVQDRPGEEWTRIADVARTTPGVVHVAPLVQGEALASGPRGHVAAALVRGIPKADLERLDIVADNLVAGSIAAFGPDAQGVDQLTMGYRLAGRLRLLDGEVVTLLSPQGAVTPFGMAPRRKGYTIGSLFNIGVAEYDSAFVYIALDEAQFLFNRGDTIDRLELRIVNPDRSQEVKAALARAIPDAIIYDWKDENASLVGALIVERNVMGLILGCVVLLSTLNIITGLIMLVKNKARDIAILRTIGASRASIARTFLLVGGALGVVGTLTGAALAVAFCLNIGAIQTFVEWVFQTRVFDPEVYSLSRIPAIVRASEVAIVVGFAVLCSFLAALLPALWAARLDPVEALRYE